MYDHAQTVYIIIYSYLWNTQILFVTYLESVNVFNRI